MAGMIERQANSLLRQGYCTNQYWDLHALVDTNPGNETQGRLSYKDLIRNSLYLSADALVVSRFVVGYERAKTQSFRERLDEKKSQGKKNFCELTMMCAVFGFL